MNRWLQFANLFGVLALAALCVVQWRINRRLNLEINDLEKTRQEQAASIEEQEKKLQGYAADLDGFREQLARAARSAVESETKLTAAENQIRQLLDERDQLKASITNWSAAVAGRDDQIQQANETLEKLAAERNEAVVRFNELVERYNAVVEELNRSRSRGADAAPAAN